MIIGRLRVMVRWMSLPLAMRMFSLLAVEVAAVKALAVEVALAACWSLPMLI
jgi:hypothetical protein